MVLSQKKRVYLPFIKNFTLDFTFVGIENLNFIFVISCVPIKADVAVLFGTKVDELGNVICEKTTKNFNPLMATAADLVIVEALEIVPAGSLSPEHLDISRIFIDYIVKSK